MPPDQQYQLHALQAVKGTPADPKASNGEPDLQFLTGKLRIHPRSRHYVEPGSTDQPEEDQEGGQAEELPSADPAASSGPEPSGPGGVESEESAPMLLGHLDTQVMSSITHTSDLSM